MEAIEYFNKDYFLLELQKAGAIKNDHGNASQPVTLEEVPNITIGLVLAAKSLTKFENHVILNWIRKGKNLTTLIKEQFALYDESLIDEQFTLYDKLSIYLLYNVYTENDIDEWKQILNGTNYISPAKGSRGWSQIFGDTPIVLKKVNPEKIANVCIVQKQKKVPDKKDEETKQENEVENKNINVQSGESNPSISENTEPNKKVGHDRNEVLSEIKPEPSGKVDEDRNEVLSEIKPEPSEKVDDINVLLSEIKPEQEDKVDEDRNEVLYEIEPEPNDKVDKFRNEVLSETRPEPNDIVDEDRNEVLSEIKPEPSEKVDEDRNEVLSEIKLEPNEKVDKDRNEVLSKIKPKPNEKVDKDRNEVLSEIKPEPKDKVDEDRNKVLCEMISEPNDKVDEDRNELLSELEPEPNDKVDEDRNEVLSEIKLEPKDKVEVDKNVVLSKIKTEPKDKVDDRSKVLSKIKREPKDNVEDDRIEVLFEIKREPKDKDNEDRNKVLSEIKQEPKDKVEDDIIEVLLEIKREPKDKVDKDRIEVLSEIKSEPKDNVEDDRIEVLFEIKQEPKDKVEDDRIKVLSEIKQEPKDKVEDDEIEVLFEIKREPKDNVDEDRNEVLSEVKPEPKDKVDDVRNEVLSEIKQEPKDKVEDDRIEVLFEIKREPKDKADEDRKEVLSKVKPAAFKGSGSDGTKYIPKSISDLSNLLRKGISLPEFSKDTRPKIEDDNFDCDDALEDVFHSVFSDLTAATEANNDNKSQMEFSNKIKEEPLSESVLLIQSAKEKKIQGRKMTMEKLNADKKTNKSKERISHSSKLVEILSDDDIDGFKSKEKIPHFSDFVEILSDDDFDGCTTVGLNKDSNTTMQEIRENRMDDTDSCKIELEVKVKRKELAEVGATEAETPENSVEPKYEDVHRGFTVEYFYSILNEAGIVSNIKSCGELTLYSHITVGLVCAIKALDIFTNEEIFSWIMKCGSITPRSITQHDHLQLASYRELANYLMNEVDIKDEERWKIVLAYTSYLEVFQNIDQECLNQDILQKNLQWEIIFGNVPEICHSVRIKFNYNYFFAQLLGYDAVSREVEDGILTYCLVEPLFLSVGLVLAAKVVDIFSDKAIISWICKCKNLNSIDSEKTHEQLAIYREFGNYLAKKADERDYERVKLTFFTTFYEEPQEGYKTGWHHTFNLYISLHKRFRDFKCHRDSLLSRANLASLELADPVPDEPSEVCKLWNDLFAKNSDRVSDKHSHDKPFHSSYFRHLLISNKVTNTYEKRNKSLKLGKVEKVTVGLVMAAIHENFKNREIISWLNKFKFSVSNGGDLSRQIFMYKILSDHFLSLECNSEARFWKQLINSVEYQGPNGNCNIWSNIFGNQIQNLLGMTLVGKFEFERLYEGLNINHKGRHQAELLLRRCIQLTHDLESFNSVSINEKQNFVFDKEYFESLLLSCGAISDSSKILKKVSDLTIGQVMATIIDNTRNEEDIYDWIKQSEKNFRAKKTLETKHFKFQFFIYKLLASYLMNYPCESQNDLYLNSWKIFLGTPYNFSNIGDPCFEKSVSPLIHSIYLSAKWNISMKYELKSIVHEIRKNFQNQSFEKIDDIMLSNVITIPKFHIENKNKIFGFGKSFFLQKLLKDKVINKDPFKMKKYDLNSVKDLTIGHVVGVLALEKSKLIVINIFGLQNWINESLGFSCNVPLGFLMRISHYLLCEVPSELSMEWNHLLDEKFSGFIENKSFALSFNNLIFKEKTSRFLFKDIKILKHCNEYIPQECRKFISGACTQFRCTQHHICSKNNYCISFPKSHNGKTKKEGSETLIDTKVETESVMATRDGSEAIKASRTNEKYENVIIFADKVYKPFLQQMELRSDFQKVWVAADNEFTPANVKWYVEECCKENRSGRLLCLLVTGLYDFAPLKNTKTFPLTDLPSIGDLLWNFSENEKNNQMITELTLKGYKCKHFVENILSDKAVVVLVPPLPGFITQYGNDCFKHHEHLVKEYKEFCLQWATICCDMFSLQNLDYEIIMSYMKKCDKFVSMMNPSTKFDKFPSIMNPSPKPITNIQDIKEKLNDWHKMIQQVLESDSNPQNVCLRYNQNNCSNTKETCQNVHKCKICGNEDHGKMQCNVLDKSICLKYNTFVCDDIKCKLTHKCLACEQGNHAAMNCKMNFIHHFSSTTMNEINKTRKVKYKSVVLIGNQVALRPFISSGIPELKVISNIKQLAIDVKLDCQESSMIILSILKSYMIKHPELSSETLWILISDMTNWLHSDSLCRSYFSDTIHLCAEEIKMLNMEYDVSKQFYKAEEFVLKALPYLGENSDFILTPFIGQTVLCPPEIFPSDIPSVSSRGLLKMNLGEFHNVVHKTPGLQKLHTFSPGHGVNKEVLSKHLARFDQKWMDSVKFIYKKINLPEGNSSNDLQYCLQSYVDIKEETFKVLENIHLYTFSNTYDYWTAYMVLLIKYLCDPMSNAVVLKSAFDKKVYNIKNKTEVYPDFKLHGLPGSHGYDNPLPSPNLYNSPGPRGPMLTGAASTQISHIHGPRLSSACRQNYKLMEVLNEIEAKNELRLTHGQRPWFPPGQMPQFPPGQEPSFPLGPRPWFHPGEMPRLPSNNSTQLQNNGEKSIVVELKKKYIKTKEKIHKEYIPEAPVLDLKESNKPMECIADAKRRIFVYNLTKDLESEDLYDILQVCGDIEEFERDILENVDSGAAVAELTAAKSEMVASTEKWCNLCKSHFDSHKTLIVHKAGSWHRNTETLQKIKQQKDCFIKELESSKLRCLICCEDMILQKLEQHLVGVKHKSTRAGFGSVRFKNVQSVYRAYRMLNGRTLHNKNLRVLVPLEDSFSKREKEGDEHEAVLEKQMLFYIKEIFNKIENKTITTEKENRSHSKKEFDEDIDKKDFSINLAEGDNGHSSVVTNSAKDKVIDIIKKNIEVLSKKIEKKKSNLPSKHIDSGKRKRSRSKDRTDKSSSTVDTGKRKGSRRINRTDRSSSTSNKEKNVDIKKNKRSRSSSTSNKEKNVEIKNRNRSRSMDRKNRSSSTRIKERTSSGVNVERLTSHRKRSRTKSRTRSRSRSRRKSSRSIDIDSYKSGKDRSRSLRRFSSSRSSSSSSSSSSSRSSTCSRSRSKSHSGRGSRNRSSVHRGRSCLSQRDERPSMQHQPPSLPPPPPPPTLTPPPPPPPPPPISPPPQAIATSSVTPYNQQGQPTLPATSGFDSPGTSNVFSSQPSLISSPHLSQNANQSKILNTSSDSSGTFSVLGITSMLYNMCDQFDLMGHSLKRVLENVLEVKNNEEKMLEVFAAEDNIKLLKEVLNIFSKLLETVHDTQTKMSIVNLVNYTKQLIRMAENSSSFSAASSSKNIPYSKMIISPSLSSDKSLLSEFDVENAAIHTLTKNTSYIIAHIKRELENLGIFPTKEIINKFAMEISVRHSKMNFSPTLSSDKSLLSEFDVENAARHSLKKDTPSPFLVTKSSSSTISYSKMNINTSFSSDKSLLSEFDVENPARHTLKQDTPSPFSAETTSSGGIPYYEMNNSPSLSSDKSLLSKFDLEKAARNTMNTDTPYIVAHIKRELENLGIFPTKEIIRKFAMEITVHHFKMEAMEDVVSVDLSSNPMHERPVRIDYGHGSANASSKPMHEQPASIDYGHGSANASDCSSHERNWCNDENRIESGNQINRNQSLSAYRTVEPQSSGLLSQQSAGHCYQYSRSENLESWQTSSNILPGKEDRNRSGNQINLNPSLGTHSTLEPISSGMPSQQNAGHMYQSSGMPSQLSAGHMYQSSGMPSQQSAGHMYQSSGNMQLGNTWFQSLGNIGNELGQNEGNVQVHHAQWNNGSQGLVSGMQGYSQGQDHDIEEHWSQGQSSFMPQGRHGKS